MGKHKHADNATAATERPRKFRVHLAANTPLAHESADIQATAPEEAWGKFCEMNGISGSSCERTITEV